jgi:hypothetical protein
MLGTRHRLIRVSAGHRRASSTIPFMVKAAPAPVRRLLEAANANDSEAFLATFVDRGVVDDWGRQFVGAQAIRGWSDREFIGKRVSLDVRVSRMTIRA